jgi:rhodanese-related sulfurtransferase
LPESEYEAIHIAGSINVPLKEMTPETLQDLDRSRPTVVYCADGPCDVSPRAAALLVAEGFTDVYDYEMGMEDWSSYALPVEGSDAEIATAGDLADAGLPLCGPDDRLANLPGRIGDHALCGVVAEDGVLIGRLRREDIEDHPDIRAREIMHRGPSTFRPDVPVSDMAEWFEKREFTGFIITASDGRPCGVLYRDAVEHVMNEHAAQPQQA